jgi:hypothetical protein
MGLSLRKNLKIKIDTDGQTDLTLHGPYTGVTVLGGTLRRTAGGVILTVAKGKRTLTLRPY